MKRLLLRAGLALGALVVGLTGIIGVAHTQVGRPLLAYMPWGRAAKGLCPLGYDAPRTAADRAAAARRFAASHRGAVPAPLRPALGFALDSATRADVAAWAASKGIRCHTPRIGHDLECHGVPAVALPRSEAGAQLRSLWLDFGADGRLSSVIALRREPEPSPISASFAAIRNGLTEQAGAPSAVTGKGTPAELEAGLLSQSSIEFRFTNYYALARATTMKDGYLLTEEYHALD